MKRSASRHHHSGGALCRVRHRSRSSLASKLHHYRHPMHFLVLFSTLLHSPHPSASKNSRRMVSRDIRPTLHRTLTFVLHSELGFIDTSSHWCANTLSGSSLDLFDMSQHLPTRPGRRDTLRAPHMRRSFGKGAGLVQCDGSERAVRRRT